MVLVPGLRFPPPDIELSWRTPIFFCILNVNQEMGRVQFNEIFH